MNATETAVSSSLSVRNLTKSFPRAGEPLVVLSDLDLDLSGGDAIAIMGPSGSGKSTLLNILGTLDAPTSGEVRIDDENAFDRSEKDLARFRNQKIGFVFQEHHLMPQLSVLENVLLPTIAFPDASANGTDQRATELLERVGLSERTRHTPAELSGGERQRVAIARALINQPSLLLADEPTGNLDQTTAESVADLLVEVQRDRGCAMVVVTHSPALAKRFGRIADMNDGKLIER